MVVTSLPVLGVSPGAGVTGAWVLGGGSRLVSVGGGRLGSGTGMVLAGLGCGFTGAGFSGGGGVGTASRASRWRGAGAGAARSSTAYTGGDGGPLRAWVKRNVAAAAGANTAPIIPAPLPGRSPRARPRTVP